MTNPALPRETFSYSRFRTATRTVDIPRPVLRYQPVTSRLRSVNYVADALAEYLSSPHLEEQLQVEFLGEPEQLAQLRGFFDDHARHGRPFELWRDRFEGSGWLFQWTLRDQNTLKLVLSQGSQVYVDYDATLFPGVKALQLTGGQYLTVPLAQASAATPTGFDDPLDYREGALIVDFKPAYPSSDGLAHYIVNATKSPLPPPNTNLLRLYNEITGSIDIDVWDAAGVQKRKSTGAITWVVGDRLQIVASWATDGTLKLWYSKNGGAFAEGTTSFGAGTGILSATPNTLNIGAHDATQLSANGTYARVLFLKRAFPEPLKLADYKPVERNYYPRAEWVTPLFQTPRYLPQGQLWRPPLVVRNGAAAA